MLCKSISISILTLVLVMFTLILNAQNIARANHPAPGPYGVQVNTFSGNLFLDRTDLVLPNQGLSLNLSFSYNSFRDTLDVGYGYGWMFSYSMMYGTWKGGVYIDHPDGRRDSFFLIQGSYRGQRGIFDMLTQVGQGRYTLSNQQGMKYFFDDATHKKLTKIEDLNGNTINLTYTNGQLTAISDPSNRRVNLVWAAGRLSQINDPNFKTPRRISYGYDKQGHLIKVSDPLNNSVLYGYDTNLGVLNQITNELGNVLAITYNETGQVTQLSTCIGKTNLNYNPVLNKTHVTESQSNGDQITTYDYDQDGRLLKKTGSCCGFNTQFEYDDDNNLRRTVNANGQTTKMSHDDSGRPVLLTDPLGQKQEVAFASNLNRPLSFRDKKGTETKMAYDPKGNLLSLNQTLGVNIGFTYDSKGNVNTIKDGNGNQISMAYNANNQVTSLRDAYGEENYVYDEAGNLQSVRDALGNTYSFVYDALNRLVSSIDPVNNQVFYEYDATSNLQKEIDANGNVRSYSYDEHNRLVGVNTPSGKTNYTYSSTDNLTSLTDANKHTSKFEYNDRNLLIEERDALGFLTKYDYDGNGNVVLKADANGNKATYVYDALNRLIRKTYLGNTDNYEYDENNNLINTSNNEINISFRYDVLNRLIEKTVNNWGKSIRYEYDKAGNRTKMIDPNGGVTNYTWDLNNRLVQITNPRNESTRFTYNNAGRLLQQQHFNGTLSIYTYDRANRLLSLTHTRNGNALIASYAYTYDKNGNRLSMTDHTGGRSNYVYDGDNRLIRVNYASGTIESYSFDGAGNRLNLNRNGNSTNYSYDAADRLQTAGNATYQFDKNGNMVSKTQAGQLTRYTYDGENRLVEVQLPNGKKVQYQYDPFGNRISQSLDATTTRYFHDGDNVLMELDGDNQTLARYTAALNMDSWISMERNGQSLAYHTDGLGSVTTLTGSNQMSMATYTYDAYGQLMSRTGTVMNPYLYTGRERDSLTGLYYYRTRYYDAEVGRFISKDVYKFNKNRPSSINRYAYTEGNPIIYTDPQGQWIWLVINLAFTGYNVYNFFSENYKKYGTDFKCYEFSINLFDLLSWILKIPNKIINKELIKYMSDKNQYQEDILKLQHQFLASKLNYYDGYLADHILKFKSHIKSLNNNILDTKKQKEAYEIIEGLFNVGSEISNDADIWQLYKHAPCLNGSGSNNKRDTLNLSPPTVSIPIIRSYDPNEIIGPRGYGLDKWVAGNANLAYTIMFENDPKFASAAAQRVVIEHQLDSDLNPASFRLGSFGFGKYFFEVPKDASFYTRRLDFRDSLGIFMDVLAGIDVERNRAFWIFESLDPRTGLNSTLPATTGFLPVNDSLLRNGEGFVNFTIQPRITAKTGDIIDAKAEIFFDDNPSIVTNAVFNTIDADRPQSRILQVDKKGDTYHLQWEGSDKGAGLESYTLYVATNKGPFSPRVLGIDTTRYTFRGNPDSTYRFFTLSKDHVGNIELMKYSGEPSCLIASLENIKNSGSGTNNATASIKVNGTSTGLSFSWSHDRTLSGPVATNLPVGVHNVSITDNKGCSTVLSFEIKLTVGTKDPQFSAGLLLQNLFPSPTNSQITVTFLSPEELVFLEIHDNLGRKVLAQNVNAIPMQASQTTLNVSNFANGLYIVTLSTRGGRRVSGMFSKQD